MPKLKKAEAEANKIQSDVTSQQIQNKKIQSEQLGQELSNKEQKLNLMTRMEGPDVSQQDQPFNEKNEKWGSPSSSWARGYAPGTEQEYERKQNDGEGGLFGVDVSGARDAFATEEENPGGVFEDEETPDEMLEDEETPDGMFEDEDDQGVSEQVVVPDQPDIEDPYGNLIAQNITGGGGSVINEGSRVTKEIQRQINDIDNQISSIGKVPEELEESKMATNEIQSFFNETSKKYNHLIEEFKMQNEGLEKERKELVSPSYRRAIQDIPLVSRVSAIIHASIQGYLGSKDPLSLLNSLIDRNYQDQVAEYNIESELLDKKESTYSKMFAISKNQIMTESNFKQAGYELVIEAN